MNPTEATTAGAILQSQPEQPKLFRLTSDDPGWIETILLESGKWMKAADVLLRVGLDNTEDHKRMVRDIASQSRLIISGQEGYLHLQHATADQVNQTTEAWMSQGKKMIQRAIRVRRMGHALLERKAA